jgi:hypothetical protein
MAKIETPADCLDVCYGKPAALEQLIAYADDSIVSKTLLDKPIGTITLFAFDKGQRLSEHTAPFDAVVQGVDGHGVVTIIPSMPGKSSSCRRIYRMRFWRNRNSKCY